MNTFTDPSERAVERLYYADRLLRQMTVWGLLFDQADARCNTLRDTPTKQLVLQARASVDGQKVQRNRRPSHAVPGWLRLVFFSKNPEESLYPNQPRTFQYFNFGVGATVTRDQYRGKVAYVVRSARSARSVTLRINGERIELLTHSGFVKPTKRGAAGRSAVGKTAERSIS